MRYFSHLTFAFILAINNASARSDEQAEVRTLIDKAIKASGGEERVAKLKAVTWKTKATARPSGEANYSDESSAQGLDQYRADIAVVQGARVGRLIQVVNRDKAWYQMNDKTLDTPKDFLAPRLEIYYLLRLPEMLLPLKAKESKLSPLGEIRIGDRPAIGVRATRAGHADVNIFFDKETGLFAKSEARLKLPDDREVVVAYLVSDYKDFDGLKHFTRFTVEFEGEVQFDVELSDIRAVGELADGVFGKP